MALVKLFESSHIALGRLLRQLIICRLRCLGFGCGHVYLLGQARNLTTSACLARWSRFRDFQGSGTVYFRMPAWESGAKASTLNAACDAALRARRCLTRS